jgi:hypothetical protein
MNWRRGLLRLWAVSSIAWIIVTFILANPIQQLRDPIAAYHDKFKVTEARAAGYSDNEISAYLFRLIVIDFAKKAVIPPLLLLALGFGGRWVVRGFRGSTSN